jgi:hypothetical protein
MILILIVAVIVVAVILYFILKSYFNKQYLLKNGVPTSATVVSVTKTAAETSNSQDLPKRIYEIDFGVKSEDEPYRLVTVRRAFGVSDRVPGEGDSMTLLIDPKNPDNAMISPWQHKGE